MNSKDIAEQAYKNGYEKGKTDAKEEIERLIAELCETRICATVLSEKLKAEEQAVKDTAKEILQESENLLHECAMEYANAGHKDYFGVCEVISHKVIRKIAKDKGVEVE